MEINQIFPSIQGEGHDIGRPCIFIRMQGCNLNCPFCDTKYAREKDGSSSDLVDTEIKKNELNRIIIENPLINKLVITGGEPFLQFPYSFIEEYRFKNIQIETNGTLIGHKELGRINEFARLRKNVHLSVSPKIDKSCYKDEITFNEIVHDYRHVLRLLNNEHNQFSFDLKLVYDLKSEKRINEFLVETRDLLPEQIYVMPLTPEPYIYQQAQRICLDTIDYCKRTGFTYSPRLQVDLFGGNSYEQTD